jgi:CheY-like chemotaxis protein
MQGPKPSLGYLDPWLQQTRVLRGDRPYGRLQVPRQPRSIFVSSVFNILHVEDSCDDADLVRLALHRSAFPYVIRRVDTEPDFIAALEAAKPDLILCDYDMPRFSAERAFAILRERGMDLPFIVVSHHVGGGRTLIGAHRDADDYLAKRDLGRLSEVIAAAMERGRGAPA